jgi:hypothetical protein
LPDLFANGISTKCRSLPGDARWQSALPGIIATWVQPFRIDA